MSSKDVMEHNIFFCLQKKHPFRSKQNCLGLVDAAGRGRWGGHSRGLKNFPLEKKKEMPFPSVPSGAAGRWEFMRGANCIKSAFFTSWFLFKVFLTVRKFHRQKKYIQYEAKNKVSRHSDGFHSLSFDTDVSAPLFFSSSFPFSFFKPLFHLRTLTLSS